MNINIDNLPPMPSDADWEYHYGPVNEKWQESLAIGVVYHYYEQWHRSGCGFGWLVYARPKPAPNPEPHIDIPIEWSVYPVVRIIGIDGQTIRSVADIGLVHRKGGREYRLARFLFPDGASLRFSVDENFGKVIKATHARFYPVAE